MFDNSEPTTRLLLRIANGAVVKHHLDYTMTFHHRIARAVATGLGMRGDEILAATRSD